MLRTLVGNHIAREVELILEKVVEYLVALTGVVSVDLLICTHHGASSCVDSILERLHVKFVDIVIGNDAIKSRDSDVVVVSGRVPEQLLLNSKEVFDVCGHRELHAGDHLRAQLTLKIRVCAESLNETQSFDRFKWDNVGLPPSSGHLSPLDRLDQHKRSKLCRLVARLVNG